MLTLSLTRLGLYLRTLIIGHKYCNMFKYTEWISIAKGFYYQIVWQIMRFITNVMTDRGRKTCESHLVHKAHAQVNLQDNIVVYFWPHRKAFFPILHFYTKR